MHSAGLMDGQGLLYVIDQLGKNLAATQAENESLKQQNEQLTEALTQRATAAAQASHV